MKGAWRGRHALRAVVRGMGATFGALLLAATALAVSGGTSAAGYPSSFSHPAVTASGSGVATYGPKVALVKRTAGPINNIAVDTLGDVFYSVSSHADTRTSVFEIRAGCAKPQVVPHTQSRFPSRVAVDHRGDLFVAGATHVWRLAAVPSQERGCGRARWGVRTVLPLDFAGSSAGDVAVDARGDVFVVALGATGNQVLELPAGSRTAAALPFGGLLDSGAVSLAADAAGDVFVLDQTPGRVFELTSGASQPIQLPFTGLQYSGGVAVDGSGDVFVDDSAHGRIVELPRGAAQQRTLPLGRLEDSWAIAFDPSGGILTNDLTALVDFPALPSPGVKEFDPPRGSANWIGYAQVASGGHRYTAVRATFRVPRVTDAGATCPPHLTGNDHPCFQLSIWVGIGGDPASDPLIQDGMQINMAGGGGPTGVNAWSETPNQATPCPTGSSPTIDPCSFTKLVLHPGDVVTATVAEISSGTWRMRVRDDTTGQGRYRDIGATTGGGSAEVIAERVNGGDTDANTGPGLPHTTRVVFTGISYKEAQGHGWSRFFKPPRGSTLSWIPMTPWADMLSRFGTAMPSAPNSGRNGFVVSDGPMIPTAPSS